MFKYDKVNEIDEISMLVSKYYSIGTRKTREYDDEMIDLCHIVKNNSQDECGYSVKGYSNCSSFTYVKATLEAYVEHEMVKYEANKLLIRARYGPWYLRLFKWITFTKQDKVEK